MFTANLSPELESVRPVLSTIACRAPGGVDGERSKDRVGDSPLSRRDSAFADPVLADLLVRLPLGIGLVGANGQLTLSNAALATFVRDPALPISEWATMRSLRGDADEATADFTYRTPEGTQRWARARLAPFPAGGGGRNSLLTVQDIDELKRHEQAHELLIGELEHRTRNILAVVGAVVTRTLTRATSLDEFAREFSMRLAQLSRVNELRSAADSSPPDLATLIEGELEALGAGSGTGRSDLAGPKVLLTPECLEILALCIHELCTNATKHGALKSAGGLVRVTWQLDVRACGKRLQLEWRESGVPLDLDGFARRRKGFGTRLIETLVPGQLRGTSRIVASADGIGWQLDFPLTESRSAISMLD